MLKPQPTRPQELWTHGAFVVPGRPAIVAWSREGGLLTWLMGI